MARFLGVPFRDLPVINIALFIFGLASALICYDQFMRLIDGDNARFLFGLMIFGPGCLFAVSFITSFSPALCRNHLNAYVALISGVEIGIALYLGYAATQWYVTPGIPHLEPTVVSLTLIIGCLQWSKRKWELRVRALIQDKQQSLQEESQAS